MSNFKFGIRNQCIFLAIYSAVILLFASAMSHGGHSTTEKRYVCSACAARGMPAFFSSRANAHMHMAKSSRCKGSAVKSVTIPIRPGDVIAGGAGGMGPCPAPQHQPPGKCHYTYIYLTYDRYRSYKLCHIVIYIYHIPGI